jgi:hypothetical protein
MRARPKLSTGARVPASQIAANLTWKGVALSDPDYTFWGASPVEDDEGYTHLFASRRPEENVDPAWRSSSEIAHYRADNPEGPFVFQSVVLQGSRRQGEWDAYGPHNPEIKRFGDRYALLYIANSDYRQPPHPLNQSIGMVLSHSLDGPWRGAGAHGQILSGSLNPEHWTHKMHVVNPAIVRWQGSYLLYFKSRVPGKKGSVYGVAVASDLEGPFALPDKPFTDDAIIIEDAAAFAWGNRVCMLTTDNHGSVTGVRGGGALWVSSDGIHFDGADVQLGYDRIPTYFKQFDAEGCKHIYGPDPKLERPKVLMRGGEPSYLYGPSGWAVHGGDRTACYVLKIDIAG